MKTGRIFWGVLFLALGALLLLDRLSSTPIHFAISWKLWPLLLVCWGLAVIVSGKVLRYALAVLAAIFLAVLVMSIVAWEWEGERDEEAVSAPDQVFHESYSDSIHHASFTLESGAGTFTLRDTSSELMTARTSVSVGAYHVERDRSDDHATLALRYEGRKRGWRFNRIRNSADIMLHPAPVWDLRFEVGATRLDVDASPFSVESLDIDAGAADVRVKLGDRIDNIAMRINSGASSVRVLVPRASGCEVNISAPLSSKSFNGFEKIEKGLYRTENYSTAPKRVSIVINAGVSSLKVVRY
jgi:hypothetical protein